MIQLYSYAYVRGVVPGGAGGAMAYSDFGRSVNPISNRGRDYAHQIIMAPPDFQTFLRPCMYYVCIATIFHAFKHKQSTLNQ